MTIKTGAEAWQILKNFLLDQRFYFSDNLSLGAILENPTMFNEFRSLGMGSPTEMVSGLKTGIGESAFDEQGTLTIVIPEELRAEYDNQAEITLQLSYLEGDNMGTGVVGDVDDLLSGLHFGPQNIEAFWNGLDQDERDRVRASLWYAGFYGKDADGNRLIPSFGQAPTQRDNGALVNLASRLLQSGGEQSPLEILKTSEKEFNSALAEQTKDSKSTAMREFLAGLHEEDIYGTTEADRMTQELINVYEEETGMRLSEEQTKNAFDQMLNNRMGDEISAENRYGRDTMNVTDIFLGHYFNNGYYSPEWQQIMGRERLDRGTFIDTAVNMGLGTRQEIRKLRNVYDRNFGEIVTGVSDPFKPYDRSDNIRRLAPHERDYSSEEMQRYFALEQQVMRETFAGILNATGGDLLTATYLFNEGIGNSFFTSQDMGAEDIKNMIDSTNAHIASGTGVLSMSPSDIGNSPEDIARRALIGANINLNTGHKAAGAAKALAQGINQSWGSGASYDYRSVT